MKRGVMIASPHLSDFYEGLKTFFFAFVTCLRNLSCVTEAGTTLRGRNYNDANGLHWKAVISV
jgi:hypothetical protein